MSDRQNGEGVELSQRIFQRVREAEVERLAGGDPDESLSKTEALTREIVDKERLVAGMRRYELPFEILALRSLMPHIISAQETAEKAPTDSREAALLGPIGLHDRVGISATAGAMLIAAQALEQPLILGSEKRNITIYPNSDPEIASREYAAALTSQM